MDTGTRSNRVLLSLYLCSALPIKTAALCNILEEEEAQVWPIGSAAGTTRTLTFAIKPFQVVTLKVSVERI